MILFQIVSNLLQKGRVHILTNIVNRFEQQSGIKVTKANLFI